jgi:hypothetical protein
MPKKKVFRRPDTRLHVWRLPNEPPGTLVEIFTAEDSRRSNVILYALKEADAFQKCSEVIGRFDPYDLIMSLGLGIACHLSPLRTPSSLKGNNRRTAKYARAAAEALENLSACFKGNYSPLCGGVTRV